MSIVLFIIIVAVLILAHEAGHFFMAKRWGVSVPEFGVGFPPKLWGVKKGETEYTINALPFGGFVRIGGETAEDEQKLPEAERAKGFASKPAHVRAGIIVAGVFFNMLLAWLLLSIGFLIGLPTPVSVAPAGATLSDVSLVITHVVDGSPAERAGLQAGDVIVSIGAKEEQAERLSASSAQDFIGVHGVEGVTVSYKRGREDMSPVFVVGEAGVVEEGIAVGISMNDIGKAKLPVHLALWEGLTLSLAMFAGTTVGLFDFFAGVFTGSADFSSIAGPVGIVAVVSDAAQFGFVYLLSLTALISINLAVINLLPLPSLDGGRLLFLGIEALKGSPIHPRVAGALQTASFALLVLLLVAVTYSDIVHLVRG